MRKAKPNQPMIEPLESRQLFSVQQFAVLGSSELNPRDLTPFNNELLFFGQSPLGKSGLHLWMTDGTAKGTHMLKDVAPANNSQFPNNEHLTPSGDYAFFVAHDGLGVPELWRTDGTADGTILLKQFDLAEEPLSLTDYKGELVFATQGTLWKSDGTPGGTVEIEQVVDASTWPSSLVVAGDWLYFRGAANAIWRSDGTTGGTASYASPQSWSSLGTVGNNLYFSVASAGAQELWRIDPSLGMIKVGPLPAASSFTSINGKAWFIAADPIPPNQSNHTQSIWWTDGTSLHRVYTSSVGATLSGLTGVGSRVLFVSETPSTYSFSSTVISIDPPPVAAELFSLDTAHRNSVQDLGSFGSVDIRYGFVDSIRFANQAIYIVAPELDDDRLGTHEYLYKSDGTVAGTASFAKIVTNYQDDSGYPTKYHISPTPVELNGKIFFGAREKGGSFQLWSSDLTSGSAHVVYKAMTLPGDQVSNVVTIGDSLYFATFQASQNAGVWIWKTDGVHRSSLIQTFNAPYFYQPPQLLVAGQSLVISMSNTLWGLDVTGKFAKIASDIQDFALFTQTPTRLYFTASLGSDEYLWTTDGTAIGTVRLYSRKWRANDYTQYFDPTKFQGLLYFVLKPAGSSKRQLWSTDGTLTGTVRVTNLAGVFVNPSPIDIGVFGKRLCYSGRDQNGTAHLWLTDGTKGGTTLLANIAARGITQAGSNLYFWAPDEDAYPVLYASDGTKQGTTEIPIYERDAQLSEFRAIGSRLFFKGPYSGGYVSDGTEGGTGQTDWPWDVAVSVFGTSIFLTNSTGIYRGDKGHSHLVATLPAQATPGAIAQLGDRYFFPLEYIDQDSGDYVRGLWFYQQ